MASGEFIEEQIYNWTYSDEQRAKRDWKGANNPYAALPRLVLMTYTCRTRSGKWRRRANLTSLT